MSEREEALKRGEAWYRNDYRCDCGEEWTSEWSCTCNDRCPRCNKEIEPYHSDVLEEPESD